MWFFGLFSSLNFFRKAPENLSLRVMGGTPPPRCSTLAPPDFGLERVNLGKHPKNWIPLVGKKVSVVKVKWIAKANVAFSESIACSKEGPDLAHLVWFVVYLFCLLELRAFICFKLLCSRVVICAVKLLNQNHPDRVCQFLMSSICLQSQTPPVPPPSFPC